MFDVIAIGIIVLVAIFIFAPAAWLKIKTTFLSVIPDSVEAAVAKKFEELGLTKANAVPAPSIDLTNVATEIAFIASPLLTGAEARNKVIHSSVDHWLALYDCPQVQADPEAKKALDTLRTTLMNPELIK